MIIYGVAFLVLLINENAADTTAATGTKRDLDRGELARLIHHVVGGEQAGAPDSEDDKTLAKPPRVAAPLDLNYFDINQYGALKSRNKDGPPRADPGVRVHLIKNPEVLQQYRQNLRKKHRSTSSSSSSYDDSDEYDRNMESIIRRNAVFRLGKQADQAFLRENPKFALRNGEDAMEKAKKHSREENAKEKIVVSFKETKHDDYYDRPRHGDANKLNRNKNSYNDESAKRDIWDDIAKNANKWIDKKEKPSVYKKDKYNDEYKNDNYKNHDYEKRDSYDNHKKERHDDYGDSNKASKAKNFKPDERDKKLDWDLPQKDNSWDNWKSKSMEQAELLKRGARKPKWSEDFDKSKKADDWDKPKRNEEWDKQKKNEEWDKQKKNDEWDKPKKSNDWEKPKNEDNNWDRPNKATKGLASVENERKHDYFEKGEFRKEEKKKPTNEWDRAGGNSGGSVVTNKKPFVPKISDYYNPRPRIQQNSGVLGFKPFGRTSIPFVGKKGIYEET